MTPNWNCRRRLASTKGPLFRGPFCFFMPMAGGITLESADKTALPKFDMRRVWLGCERLPVILH